MIKKILFLLLFVGLILGSFSCKNSTENGQNDDPIVGVYVGNIAMNFIEKNSKGCRLKIYILSIAVIGKASTESLSVIVQKRPISGWNIHITSISLELRIRRQSTRDFSMWPDGR